MFEDSLVESVALHRTQNRWPAAIALVAQCAVALLIVSLPLLHPELLPLPRLTSTSLAPPRSPAPPPRPVHIELRPAATTSATTAPASVASTSIFRSIIHPTGSAVDAPSLPVVNLGDSNPAALPGINSAVPAALRVSVAPARPHAPLTISSGVSAGNLLAPIRPIYPEIARITHTEGTVVISATISRSGLIESAHVLGGPSMLRAAALNAVRQARYRPFLLNGQPTDVSTTITINFRMGG